MTLGLILEAYKKAPGKQVLLKALFITVKFFVNSVLTTPLIMFY